MKFIARKLLRIEKGEGRLVSILFFYLFFLISSLLILKPVSNSLFIQNIGIKYLPLGFILVAVFSGLLMAVYLPLTQRLQLNSLVTGTSLVCLFCLGLFWILFSDSHCSFLTYFIFYVWVSIYGLITASQFWLLSGRILNPRQAKRLFGFIGAGGIAGGIFGGYLASLLADTTGTRNLLFLSMIFLCFCLVLGFFAGSIYKVEKSKEKFQSKRAEKEPLKNPFSILTHSPHIFNIASIVFLSVLAATLGDYVFRHIGAEGIKNEDKLTSFFGFWQSTLSVAALVIQLLLTGRILSKLGVTLSLSVLPLGILTGAISIIFNPGIISAVILKVSDGAFKQSIYKSGMEMLYFPISSSVKKRIKGFIDVFLDNIATGAAGIFLLLILNYTTWSVVHISFIIAVVTGVWLIYLVMLKKSYLQAFRTAIEKRTIDFEDPGASHDTKDFISYLEEAINKNYTKRILYMLDLIEDYNHPDFIPLVKKMLSYPSKEVNLKAILISRANIQKKIGENQFESELSTIIIEGPQKNRIESMYNLLLWQENKTDYIVNSLNSKIKEIQWSALICAARISEENKEIREYITHDPKVKELIDLKNDNEPFEEEIFNKSSLAQMVGESRLAVLFPYLENLLNDPNPKIVKAVLPFVGISKSPYFCPQLIKLLGNPRFTTLARKSLLSIRQNVCDHIEASLKDESLDYSIKYQLPRVLSYIPGQQSSDILQDYLPKFSGTLRAEFIKALGKHRNKNPEVKIDRTIVFSQAMYLLSEWYVNYSSINQLAKFRPDNLFQNDKLASGFNLIQRSLAEKNERTLEMIFRLLGMGYKQIDLRNAYLGITSESSRLRANAVEFLDNLLDNKLKSLLFPIIERKDSASLLKKAKEINIKFYKDLNALLNFNMSRKDPWISDCSKYLLEISNN